MTDAESRIARLEERADDTEEWRRACSMLPVTVAELVQWKKDQNGDIRKLKEDVAAMRDASIVRRSWENLIKWAAVIIGGYALTQILEFIYAALRAAGRIG